MADFTSVYHRKSYPSIYPSASQNIQTGRTVLITGATTGIGLATAEAFVRARADCVVILGRSETTLSSAIDELGGKRLAESATRIVGEICDISDQDQIQGLWTKLKSRGIEVDVMILNAAVTGSTKDLLDAWSFFEMNVLSGLRMTDAFLKQGPQRGKVLLNVSSLAAHAARGKGLDAYGSSKAAGASMFQALADCYSPETLQVLSIHPGAVLTRAARRAGYDESTLPWDDVDLPASFMVWAATKQAAFLHGRFVWAHWDVDEMTRMKPKFEKEPGFLRIGLQGIEPVDYRIIFAKIREM